MIIDAIKLFYTHRNQAIQDLTRVTLPDTYRGVPNITSEGMSHSDRIKVASVCPTQAINSSDFTLDMGKCLFCGECHNCFPNNFTFTSNWKMWAFNRKDLIVKDGVKWITPSCESPFLKYRRTLRMRQVSAGGDMGCELELGACSNVNFDMSRFGLEFTASPRHAEALVFTGPITDSMAAPLQRTYDAIPDPKLLIAVGTDAISGGLFSGSKYIDRSFLKTHTPNLYVAGSPCHPLTFISAVAALIGRRLV